MNALRRLLAIIAAPTDGDSYQWAVIGLGHVMLGAALQGLLGVTAAAARLALAALYWVDGVLRESAANAWTDFTITMLYGATTGFGFIGRSGAVLSVVTDGTPARDGTMLDVRRALAAKYGITLP